jgi:peptidoglycan/xylan/chitin deacetylase (PgdA/CDA1 family)
MFQGISIVRKIPSIAEIYLTFDDGPDEASTPAVLDVLAETNTRATFFVIAEKAKRSPELLQQMVRAGHSIGNHSLDHRWGKYFQGKLKLKEWVSDSEKTLQDLSGQKTVGFRPPAGVWTPELRFALNELSMPLVLWNVRYFDTQFRFTRERAERSSQKLDAGSIILLHDRKAKDELIEFSSSLRILIELQKMKARNFMPMSLELNRKVAGILAESQ